MLRKDKNSKRKIICCKKCYKIFWYFDKVVRPLVLIIPKMSGYVKTFKVKDGDENKNSKSMSFCTDHEKLLEKKAIWT